jgi:hypothetical protein
MSWSDPYRGRRAEAGRVKAILRESTRQSGGRTLKPEKTSGIGDVSDAYLRGQAGGEAHPFFDKPRTSRR